MIINSIGSVVLRIIAFVFAIVLTLIVPQVVGVDELGAFRSKLFLFVPTAMRLLLPLLLLAL